MEAFRRKKFLERATASMDKKAANSRILTTEKYNLIVATLTKGSSANCAKEEQRNYFRWLARYDLLQIHDSYQLLQKGTQLRFVTLEDMFDAISSSHTKTGHGGCDVMLKDLSALYANISREHIMTYLELCEECHMKKPKVAKSIVVKPIVSNEFNSRCQVDLIDLQSQPDRDFKFIMVYQDHLTKFVLLKLLKTKTAVEVANHLVDIFCDKGAPHILQSDNGREFANAVVKEVVAMWPLCRIVHRKPRHSQSQGSVERANRDIQDKLACWLRDNKTSQWAEGLRFVQLQKNSAFHSGIHRTPYYAIYRHDPKMGLASTSLPKHLLEQLETEEQLEEILGSIRDATDGSSLNEMATNGHGAQGNDGSNVVAPHAAVLNDDDGGNAQPLYCVSCQNSASGAHRCKFCAQPCHAIAPCSTAVANANVEEGFGSAVICLHCSRNQEIDAARLGARQNQQTQAERMRLKSAQRFEPAKVGQTVMVPVPEVDRGRTDHRNFKAVVLEAQEDGFYILGTSEGRLKHLYARNQFLPCNEEFMSINDVPHEKEISVREAARIDSVGNGQGFFKCGCTSKCQDKKCKCLKNGVKCNSKCHSSLSCCNK